MSAENLDEILQEIDSMDHTLDASTNQDSTTYHSHVLVFEALKFVDHFICMNIITISAHVL